MEEILNEKIEEANSTRNETEMEQLRAELTSVKKQKKEEMSKLKREKEKEMRLLKTEKGESGKEEQQSV